MVSAAAAPKPDTIPAIRPLVMVRETHSTFTGPTGAEMASTARAPRKSSSNSFIIRRGPVIHYAVPRASGDSFPLSPRDPHLLLTRVGIDTDGLARNHHLDAAVLLPSCVSVI